MDLAPANEILPLIGQQGGCDAHFAGLPERRRRGTHTQSGLSDLRLGVEAHRRRILPYALKEENDWQPDFEALEKMDLSGVKLMWCNYPNMPNGSQRFAGAVRKTRRLRPQAQHRDLPR